MSSEITIEIVSEVDLSRAKPISTSMEPNHKLTQSTNPLFDMPNRYRHLIKKLIYLILTRPELAYAMHTLVQFMQSPPIDHLNAALRVIRYLRYGRRYWRISSINYLLCCVRIVTIYMVILGLSSSTWIVPRLLELD